MKRILVTGSNRGIGLELCRQLAEGGYEVHAVCRRRSEDLSGITSHIIEGIDVAGDDAIECLRSGLKAESLDGVINCAGIFRHSSWEKLDFAAMAQEIEVNAFGPLRVVKAVEDKIVSGGKVIMITSVLGSIAQNASSDFYGYRMSKAALNMASVSLALDLKPRRIAVGIVHPGYVKTDMTNHAGHIEPEEAARGIIARMEALTMENSGTFWHQNGEILPW